MKKVTTSLTYYVPSGMYCNLEVKPKELCRFCIKSKNAYTCALYNAPLMCDDKVLKATECTRAICGFKSIVSDVSMTEVAMDTKKIMLAAITEYRKLYSQLINEGYPDALADRVAREMMTK